MLDHLLRSKPVNPSFQIAQAVKNAPADSNERRHGCSAACLSATPSAAKRDNTDAKPSGGFFFIKKLGQLPFIKRGIWRSLCEA
jgi:hypothetical protein